MRSAAGSFQGSCTFDPAIEASGFKLLFVIEDDPVQALSDAIEQVLPIQEHDVVTETEERLRLDATMFQL